MAENNSGTWASVDIDLSKIGEVIDPIFEGVETILELVIAGLNILQSILQIVKAFIVGLLDPIRALVEALIEEVRNFLDDLKNLGVYFYTQEIKLVKAPFEDIKGGFQLFKNRMITAHVDSTDPSRPQFSSSTSVIGVYFYLSAQVQDIFRIVGLIQDLAAFFSLDNPSLSFPAPSNLGVTYGTAGMGLYSFVGLGALLTDEGSPDRAVINWSMPSGVGAGAGSFSQGPGGFLIDVSTSSSGYALVAEYPDQKSTSPETTRLAVPVRDPKLPQSPLRVFGGTGTIEFDGTGEVGVNKDACALYLYLDQSSEPVSVQQLKRIEDSEGKSLLGRTFYVKNSLFPVIGPGQGFSVVLDSSDLPLGADFEYASPSTGEVRGEMSVKGTYVPSTYSVVVTAVDKTYAGEIEANLSSGTGTLDDPGIPNVSRYTLTDGQIRAQTSVSSVVIPYRTLNGDSSPTSAPVEICFPGEVSEVILSALLVAVLARIDLPYDSGTSAIGMAGAAYNQTGMEPYASSVFRTLGFNPSLYELNDPIAFRRKLKNRMNRYLTTTLSKKNLNTSLITESEQAGRLTSFRWSDLHPTFPDLSLMESIDDSSRDSGVFPNGSTALYSNPQVRTLLKRSPSFKTVISTSSSSENFISGEGTQDFSPVIMSSDAAEFCRNSFYTNSTLLQDALYVLTLTEASSNALPGTQRWVSKKLLPQGWPAAEAALESIDRMLTAILDSLQGVADAIIAYIDAISARITQLQAFIVQIQALLDSIQSLKIGGASVLVLVENGSDGLLAGFVGAENQPADSIDDYGFGFALVAGGVPAVLTDLLVAIFDPG